MRGGESGGGEKRRKRREALGMILDSQQPSNFMLTIAEVTIVGMKLNFWER